MSSLNEINTVVLKRKLIKYIKKKCSWERNGQRGVWKYMIWKGTVCFKLGWANKIYYGFCSVMKFIVKKVAFHPHIGNFIVLIHFLIKMYFKNNILISVEQDLQINRNMHRASHWYLNLDRIDCLARLLFYLNKYREKLNKVIVYLNRKT